MTASKGISESQQAYAWSEVYKLCASLNMPSLHTGLISVTEFIRHLHDERNELLAACQAALEYVNQWPEPSIDEENKMMTQLEAAIAKATGK